MPYPRAYVYFTLVLGLAGLGFLQTYFTRLSEATPAQHFHAAVAVGWMLMLIAQSWAISHRKVWLHRKVGKGSYLLAPLFIGSGFGIVHAMANAGGPFREAFGTQLALVDGIAVMLFAWLYYSAISNRRNVQLHARYMTATVLLLLTPVISRVLIFYVPGFGVTSPETLDRFILAFHVGNGVALAAALVLLFRGQRSAGVSLPYAVTAMAILLQSMAFELAGGAAWWQASITAYGALPAPAVVLAGFLAGVALVLAATRRSDAVVSARAA